MEFENLPEKYKKIWDKCLKYFKQGRAGDDIHAKETVQFILNYKGNIKFDPEVIIPVAIMHDIGHAAILPEHHKYITGREKLKNSKLVHMLTGAKIAHDILNEVGYDQEKTKEIVEIISIHDYKQLKEVDVEKAYNSVNKRFFHDVDASDRYNERRLKYAASLYPDRAELLSLLKKYLDDFFFDEFKKKAEKQLEILSRN